MSKLFYKAIIEDIQNNKCSDTELEYLLDAFEYTIKRMVTTLARKAWYELKDNARAKQRGIHRFTLMLERQDMFGHEQWYDTFEYGGKKLKIIGSLERD